MGITKHEDSTVIIVHMLGGVEVLLVHTKEQLEFLIEENGLDIDGWDSCDGRALQIEQGGSAAFIIMIKSLGLNYRTLVHECVHMAQYILDYKGIPTDVDNTEVVAYLTDYLFKECLSNITEGV